MVNIKGHKLPDELVTELGKFAILWSSYEDKKCGNHASPGNIKNSIKNMRINRAKVEKLHRVFEERYMEQKRRIDAIQDKKMTVEDYIHNGFFPDGSNNNSVGAQEKEMADFMKSKNNDYGCFLMIYRVRNNFMHGLKAIECLEDQLEMFKAINDVLESIS